MKVRDIIEEIKEATGACDETANLVTCTRALQLLANEGLFDPLVGYLEFSMPEGKSWLALPRDVKTPLRLNINQTPTFFRNRIFEFYLNTNGSEDGETVGWTWSDRLYLPIQDETELPGKLSYSCESEADNGLTATIYGRDANNREISETLEAHRDAPVESTNTFYAITKVLRDQTISTCLLKVGTEAVGQYYGDETSPMYRIIQLSKTGATVRMMYRKHVFKLTSLDDFIPLTSEMAVIHACKAVRYLATDEYDKGAAAMTFAVDALKKEQAALDGANDLAGATETPSATNYGINVRDGVVVADIYDAASEVFGPIGRDKLFDRITTAIEILRNKAHWNADTGMVDIWTTDRSQIVTPYGSGTGYWVLPRFVEAPISVNFDGVPQEPRNLWFEFHLNGLGESNVASGRRFDYAGEVVVISEFPCDATTRKVIPHKILATTDNSNDIGDLVRIYGIERKSDGSEVDVFRAGHYGWDCTCRSSATTAAEGDSPDFVSVTRITRVVSDGFVTLKGIQASGAAITLGIWYPDELEPKYSRIKLSSAETKRIRVFYRKRFTKITSLFEPVPLRSRLAMETMFRAIELRRTDLRAALDMEADAVRYLSEEQINSDPHASGGLQFAPGTMPGHTDNIT